MPVKFDFFSNFNQNALFKAWVTGRSAACVRDSPFASFNHAVNNSAFQFPPEGVRGKAQLFGGHLCPTMGKGRCATIGCRDNGRSSARPTTKKRTNVEGREIDN
jgi:hypothetical protein